MKLKNWKTTTAAILTAAVVSARVLGYISQETMEMAVGLLTAAGLWAAKDHNVTGGNKQQ